MATCAELFSKYVDETESVKRRAHEMPDQINVLAARSKELVEEHDAAFLVGDQKRVDEIIAECAETDKRIQWLQHQQELLLGKRGTRDNPKLIELAQQWEVQAGKEAAVLQADWDEAEAALEQAELAYLACIAKLGAVSKKSDSLRHQANTLGMGGHTPIYVPMPNAQTDPNPQRLRGKIAAITPDRISAVYKNRKLEG